MHRPDRSAAKTGFSLIEIAIVMAVIGVLVGGIYVAAGAVRDNSRRQRLQQNTLEIVQNTRRAFTSRANFVVPNATQVGSMGLLPAGIVNDGTSNLNAFNGTIAFFPGYNGQQFVLTNTGLPQSACVNMLVSTFGSGNAVRQYGLFDVADQSTWQGNTAISNGIATAQALAVCHQPTNNVLSLMFNLRG